MKKLLALILPALLIAGCSGSHIELPVDDAAEVRRMYGDTAERRFLTSASIGDSLRMLWEFEMHGNFAPASVVCYDGYVFASDVTGKVFVVDILTGDEVGELKYGDGAVMTAPLLVGEKVVYPLTSNEENISTLYIYNFLTSELAAEKELKGKLINEGLSLSNDVLFFSEYGTLYRLGPDGTEKYTKRHQTMMHTAPVMIGDTLLVGNDDGELMLFDPESGEHTGTIALSDSIITGVTVHDGVVYAAGDDGRVYAVDAGTQKLLWSYAAGSPVTMIPAAADDIIVVGTLGGSVIALSREGEMMWRFDSSGLFNLPPLIAGDVILAPSLSRELFILDRQSGELLNRMIFPAALRLSPVFYKNVLITGHSRGVLRAYEIVR